MDVLGVATGVKRIHLVGIAASMALFGVFGLITVGGTAAVFAGVDINGSVGALATGPTPIPVADLTTPFGFPPEAIGLATDAAVILPAVPVTVGLFGVTLSVSGLTVAEVFGGGGMVVGFLVGLYYTVDIVREQREDAHSNVSPPSTE